MPTEYKENYGKGYCRHGSIVFPTWHRAYIYQFEVIAIALLEAISVSMDHFLQLQILA